jgi:hypothetical protein
MEGNYINFSSGYFGLLQFDSQTLLLVKRDITQKYDYPI